MCNCVVAVSAGRTLCCILIKAANTVAVRAACQDDSMPSMAAEEDKLMVKLLQLDLA